MYIYSVSKEVLRQCCTKTNKPTTLNANTNTDRHTGKIDRQTDRLTEKGLGETPQKAIVIQAKKNKKMQAT